jgi:rare lipoprotein A
MTRIPAFLLPLATTALLVTAPSLAQARQDARWDEVGEASWYGGSFIGRRTSSGERFDGRAMTAAHSTLPLGTRVRVTVQDTGESIVVRINDRLPPHGVRVIDLSPGAAARLGMVRRGTAWVSVAPLAPDAVEEVAEAVPPGDSGADRATPRQRGPRHTRPAPR